MDKRKYTEEELYYIAPEDELFEDMKKSAIDLWNTYDDTYGYATEKISRIKDLENVGDNFMMIFSMFDMNNQAQLLLTLKPDTKKAIRDRNSYII